MLRPGYRSPRLAFLLLLTAGMAACAQINVPRDDTPADASDATGTEDGEQSDVPTDDVGNIADTGVADAEGEPDSADTGDSEDTGSVSVNECKALAGGIWQATTVNVTDLCLDGKLSDEVFLRKTIDQYGWIGPMQLPDQIPGPVTLYFHEAKPQGQAVCEEEDQLVLVATAEDVDIAPEWLPGCEVDWDIRVTIDPKADGDLAWTATIVMSDWDTECGTPPDPCEVTLDGKAVLVD